MSASARRSRRICSRPAVSATNSEHLVTWDLVVFGFLICSSLTIIFFLFCGDLLFPESEVSLKVTYLKYGERGSYPRISTHIPCHGINQDSIYQLLYRLYENVPSHLAYIIANRQANNVSSACLRSKILSLLATNSPPSGTYWCAKSLCSGDIYSIYAAGITLPSIITLSNHCSVMVVHRRYLDALLQETPSARLFSVALIPLLVLGQSRLVGQYACAPWLRFCILD